MIPFLAPLALKLAPVKALVGRVPRWAWIALAVALLLAVGSCVHRGKVKAFGNERFAAGYAKAVDDGRKAAAKLDRKSDAIASEIRSRNDEEIRHIARRADTLRLRGPGAATCINPSVSGSASRRQPASRQSDVVGSGVSSPDRAAVPWPWLVSRAEIADANRSEVLAWREWHQRLTKEWDQLRKETDGARAEP